MLKAEGLALDALKKLLINFNLVHPITRDLQQFFVVPVLVPRAPPLDSALLGHPNMPANIHRILQNLHRQNFANIEVCEFKLDFACGNFLPLHLFERLLCAVASEASPSLGGYAGALLCGMMDDWFVQGAL